MADKPCHGETRSIKRKYVPLGFRKHVGDEQAAILSCWPDTVATKLQEFWDSFDPAQPNREFIFS